MPRTDDFNGRTQEGAGYYQLTTHNGWRCSTATAYLKPARAATEPAHRDRCACDRADARRATRDRRPLPAGRSRTGGALLQREVLLAAGAMQSPQLLQLSGIGPAALLAQHGIDVVHDAAGRRREPAGPPADPADLRMHASRSPPTTS